VLIVILLLLLIFWWVNRRQDVKLEEPQKAVQPLQGETLDDLKRIEGIGPKVEKVLQEAGIRTFDALGRANPDEVKQLLNAAGLQMMNPEGWIEQAELAAKGEWEKLDRLQDELKGGRKQ
jgi:predicted flap endonuclease-1-like 5' DNA nuclease